MQTDRILFGFFLDSIQVAAKSLEVADKVVQKLPVVRSVYGLVLDTVFGPEESFDYVSTDSLRTTSTT